MAGGGAGPCLLSTSDIGGGTTDIAVISLSGIVESTSIKIAGDQFDEAIVKYIRRKHNVLIGERTAEELKMQIGCVFPRPEEQTVESKGRCLMTGLPRVFSVSSSEMIEAFEEVSTRILEAIHGVLERTPPELVADISTNGIVMTGGGSLVWGFDKLIESHTGIETHVADDAISCVAYGTGKSCLLYTSLPLLGTAHQITNGDIRMSCQGQKILIVWHGPVCFQTPIIPKGSRTRFGRVWRSGSGLVWSWVLRTRCMSFLRLLLPDVYKRQASKPPEGAIHRRRERILIACWRSG